MTPATDARKAIAAALQAALPDGWTVYPEPPDGVMAPAVSIGPGDPYRTTTAYRTEELALRAVVLLSSASEAALDLLDAAIDLVVGALLAQDALSVRQVGSVGLMQDVGGVPYLTASIDLAVGIERTRP